MQLAIFLHKKMNTERTIKLGFPIINLMAQKVCDDQLSGWLQHLAGDQVCQDPPACGHHMAFICRGFPSNMGAAGERPEFVIKPPLGVPLLIFPRGCLEIISRLSEVFSTVEV